jgi:hypothetical protein
MDALDSGEQPGRLADGDRRPGGFQPMQEIVDCTVGMIQNTFEMTELACVSPSQ